MAFGYTRTLPTITGSHSDFPVLLTAGSFPATAVDGGANSIDNGGGNLRAYTNDTKTTQLSLEVVTFVTGGTPDIQVWVKIPVAATSNTIYLEADSVAISQPAVGAAFGRNSVWAAYTFVHHLTDTSSTVDSAGSSVWDIDTVGSGATNSLESPFGASSIDFDGTSTAQLDILNAESIVSAASDPLTIQMWVRPASLPADEMGIFVRRNTASSNNSFRVISDNANSGGGGSANTYLTQTDLLASRVDDLGANAMSVDNWQMLSFVNEQGVEQSGYLQGSQIYSLTTTAPSIDAGTGTAFYISGVSGYVGSRWDGQIAEVRAKESRSSSSFISTEYDNQSDPVNWGTSSAWSDSGGGAISVTGTTVNYNYSAVAASIDLTGSIDVTGQTPNYLYGAVSGLIDLTGEISIQGQTPNYTYSALSGTIDLTGVISVTGATASYNYQSIPGVIDLTGEITVLGSTPGYSYGSINGTVELGALVNVIGQTPNYNYQGVNGDVLLAGEISITGNTPSYSYSAINGFVSIGEGQVIGNVTAGFADDLYGAGFKPSVITVTFKT
jgi:hypothetical protein